MLITPITIYHSFFLGQVWCLSCYVSASSGIAVERELSRTVRTRLALGTRQIDILLVRHRKGCRKGTLAILCTMVVRPV
ncbi:hypothetical protein F5Y05DRAFT_90020 [Hypoxylon sp. FL0543]|nr:hypothetical protein F5Y05DRAFT_90020 [Hypoxylon sp. FL0543]